MNRIVGDSGVSITRWICSRCGSRWNSSDDCPLCKGAVRSLSSAEAGDDPLVGTRLGDRYQVMARIGRGSMGGIFRAFDTTTERQVAIKVLKKHLIRDDDLRSRFEQEAQALKRMQHKNLIAVRDFGVSTSASEPFIVMEYVDGETLASLLGELTYIPAERLVPIMVQACDALIHAHEQGILHRDLKPANIMIIDLPRERDVVKVLDFGLAKMADSAFDGASTNPGDPIGTPLYMSPEQARGEQMDARSDIYSLGTVMYECLTGVPPVTGSGVLDILKKQVSYVPPPMHEARPFLRIPSHLEYIVATCIKKERDQRYNSMLEVKEALLTLNMQAPLTSSQVPALDARKLKARSSIKLTPPITQHEPRSLWQQLWDLIQRKGG